MPIKILHTADNHIGMKFSSYKPAVKERLVKERFDSLKQIVDIGNAKQVNYLVVAGDLFDTTTVKVSDITETAKILKGFAGDAVIIIPGNHDFFESAPESLWSKFLKVADDKKIFLLSENSVFEHEVGERKVHFFPAACHSKHSAENVIGWVKNQTKQSDALNIGIAHGNVTGLGLDDADRYFNMTSEELKSMELDFWLLGHIHVPYPQTTTITQNPDFFMSGFHSPDGWKRTRGGSCWLIEVDESKNLKADLLPVGKLRFYDWQRSINSELDLKKFEDELNSLDTQNALVRVELNGRLAGDIRQKLEQSLQAIGASFLEFQYSNLVKLNIDHQYINSNYSNGSLPHGLLTALSNDNPNGLEVQLANDLIENLKS